MTGTINPENMIYTQRSNAEVRLADYITAFTKWLHYMEHNDLHRLIFCENSGYDISPLKAIVKPSIQESVSFIQTSDNGESVHRGKGHGEARMLERVVSEYPGLLQGADYIVKVTGRLFVPNLLRLIRPSTEIDMISAGIHRDTRGLYVDSRIFALKPEAFGRVFQQFSDDVDDTIGVYFERVLATRVVNLGHSGYSWTAFNELPYFRGVSGSSGRKFDTLYEILKISLKNIIYRYGYREKIVRMFYRI